MEITKGRRVLMAGLIACLSLVLGFALTACGPSDEEQVKKALDDELSTMSNPSDGVLNQLAFEAESGVSGQLDQMGISSADLMKSWTEGYSYEIGDIAVDGDSATAQVTITCKQFLPIATDWANSLMSDAQSKGFTSTDEVYAYSGQTLLSDLDAATPTTTEVTLTCQKDGNGWTFPLTTTENQQALYSALMGGDASSLLG